MELDIYRQHFNICEFPMGTSLSLEKVVDLHWRALAKNGTSIEREFANRVLEEWESTPDLHGVIEDTSLLEKYRELVVVLLSSLMPQAFNEQMIAAASEPYGKLIVYATELFKQVVGRVMKEEGSLDESMVEDDNMIYRKLLHAYLMIFKQFYGIDLPIDQTMVIQAPDFDNTGFQRFFKAEIVTKYMEVVLRSQPAELTDEALQEIIENVHDLRIWTKHLPPEHFEFRGLGFFGVIDITKQELVSRLKYDLLDKEALTNEHKFEMLQHRLRSVFDIADLKLGVTSYDAHTKRFVDRGGMMNGMLADCDVQQCFCGDEIQGQLVHEEVPFVISDLEQWIDKDSAEIWQSLYDRGVRSLLMAPLKEDGEFIGVLELGAPSVGALSAALLLEIREIIPLFSLALKRNLEERETQVESVIKKQYTAIHPAVEWRFADAAKRYLMQKEKGETPEVEEIVFKEIYPLYGASDVRNSSIHRNEAIQADLIEQLSLGKDVVNAVLKHQNMPFLKQLRYKIDKHIQHIKAGLFSGDEMEVIGFLKDEVEACFSHLKEQLPAPEQEVFERYTNNIDPDLGVVYKRRKAFEESLMAINEAVSEYIEDAQEEAQEIFPHYFEKYKTDGVEYNIYVGASLSPHNKYSNLYLKNLRLWQLTATAKIAMLTNQLKPSLQVPLDTTHLILVHSGKLSVQFRLDERQFDVDGAYNIRYEIVKKRIDKAHIKGTQERLTQPNSIAIVYSQESDAKEYREYIEYLQYQGLLEPQVEDFELEALQGVQGLRALRVGVSLQDKHSGEAVASWMKPSRTLNGHAVRVEVE